MNRFFRHWFLLALALGATAWILSGVQVSSLLSLAVAALVWGFLNAGVKPVLVALTLPITLLTLGIFYFVLNGLLFSLVGAIVPGFHVRSFGSAMAGALIMGFFSWMLNAKGMRRD